MNTSAEHIIAVPGGNIWSEIITNPAVSKKPPMIFLHGGPGSTPDKLKWGLTPLADTCPLIFYDQLGGGKSGLGETELNNSDLWQVSRFVAELECLVDFYKLQEFYLFGTSWGASLALEYIFSTSSHKVKGLILGSPLINTKMWVDDANRLKQLLPQDVYATMLRCEKAGTTDSAEYEKACEIFYDRFCLRTSLLNREQLDLADAAKGGFNKHAYNIMWGPSEFFPNGSLVNYDRYADLAKLNIPTLFVCGEYDEATPQTVQLFHEQVPGSQFHVFAGCSHQAYFENSPAYSDVLRQFVKQIG